METEPSFDDAANYRFENLYRVNWIEKLPDYQYPCLHLPFYQICDTFDVKNLYDKYCNHSNINAFKMNIIVPEELKNLNRIEDMPN